MGIFVELRFPRFETVRRMFEVVTVCFSGYLCGTVIATIAGRAVCCGACQHLLKSLLHCTALIRYCLRLMQRVPFVIQRLRVLE